jgi:hypothetical protein
MMMLFLDAIAHMEGFYHQGTRPQRNNNPGDLEFRPWQEAFGATWEKTPAGVTPRFAAFPSPKQGFQAMAHLFTFPIYAGKTVAQALNTWAPPVENNTSAYQAYVCAATGLTPDTVLTPELLAIPVTE